MYNKQIPNETPLSLGNFDKGIILHMLGHLEDEPRNAPSVQYA